VIEENGTWLLSLRAERDPKIGERLYTINVVISDASGNTATQQTLVTVQKSKDKSKKSAKSKKSG
jgi:hypothetical protein